MKIKDLLTELNNELKTMTGKWYYINNYGKKDQDFHNTVNHITTNTIKKYDEFKGLAYNVWCIRNDILPYDYSEIFTLNLTRKDDARYKSYSSGARLFVENVEYIFKDNEISEMTLTEAIKYYKEKDLNNRIAYFEKTITEHEQEITKCKEGIGEIKTELIKIY